MMQQARNLVRNLRSRVSGTITHVVTEAPLVALTFDDGPDPMATPALLEILASFNARATFFMTGEKAEIHPELVVSVRNGGHALGNHSWDHPSFPLISGQERRRQIRRCARLLGGGDTAIFRPPYGHQSKASRRDTFLTGHEVVAWNVCVPDWEVHDGGWLADFALQRIKPGSIVLMHDGLVDFAAGASMDRRPTLDAVGRILGRLQGSFEFVTVPELLRRGKAVRTPWWMQPDLEMLNSLKRASGVPRRYQS